MTMTVIAALPVLAHAECIVQSSTEILSPIVITAQYYDRYEQIARGGTNNIPFSWDIKWVSLTYEEVYHLDTGVRTFYLSVGKSDAFSWASSPSGPSFMWRFTSDLTLTNNGAVYDISASIEQVF